MPDTFPHDAVNAAPEAILRAYGLLTQGYGPSERMLVLSDEPAVVDPRQIMIKADGRPRVLGVCTLPNGDKLKKKR